MKPNVAKGKRGNDLGRTLRMALDKRTGRGQKPVENLVLFKVREVMRSMLSVAGCFR